MNLLSLLPQPVSYSLFGMHIASELDLHELPLLDRPADEADIHIRLGSTPDKLENPSLEALLFSMTTDEYLLHIPECSRYWVRQGKEIICNPEPDCSHADLLVYVYGTCLAAICYQRKLMPFHASVIEAQGGAWLFAGNSGAGKSTLTAGLLELGYSAFSDDLCLLEETGLRVAPGVPRVKLWQHSIEHYGWENRPKEPVVMRQEKFQFRTTTSNQHWLPLRGVFTLDVIHHQDIELIRLQGVSALRALEANLFRINIIRGLNANADYFNRCMKLSMQLPIYYIQRPRQLDAMSAVLSKLTEIMGPCIPAAG